MTDSKVKLVYNATKEGLQKIFEKAGGDGIAETNVDVSFSLGNPRAMDWVNEHALVLQPHLYKSIFDEVPS